MGTSGKDCDRAARASAAGPRFTREQLGAELAHVARGALTPRFQAELSKFEDQKRREAESARRLGNE